MGNGLARMIKGKKSSSSSSKKDKASKKKLKALEEELIDRQMLAFALQQQQKSIRLERASSQRNNPNLFPEKLPRSASTRPRSLADPIVPPHQLINGIKPSLENLETKHFVLVHGAGNGAWCWYKSIALLEEAGFTASAVDLTGSGIDHTDPNTISTLSQYAKPLLLLLEKLPDDEKVILVGHDFGGACISYAMETFPTKIAKAIFVTAAMVTNGQKASDIFAPDIISPDDLLPRAQQFIYADESTRKVPTALEFDKSLIKDVFFNQSPAKDVALATVSLRPVPFAPTVERLCLTPERYGSVRRFFIHTTDDCALTPALQERLVSNNPPERVFHIRGSDHSPFFSKPQSLHKLLLEIAQLEPLVVETKASPSRTPETTTEEQC